MYCVKFLQYLYATAKLGTMPQLFSNHGHNYTHDAKNEVSCTAVFMIILRIFSARLWKPHIIDPQICFQLVSYHLSILFGIYYHKCLFSLSWMKIGRRMLMMNLWMFLYLATYAQNFIKIKNLWENTQKPTNLCHKHETPDVRHRLHR